MAGIFKCRGLIVMSATALLHMVALNGKWLRSSFFPHGFRILCAQNLCIPLTVTC